MSSAGKAVEAMSSKWYSEGVDGNENQLGQSREHSGSNESDEADTTHGNDSNFCDSDVLIPVSTPEKWWKNYVHVPILFLNMFSYSLLINPATQLYMDRGCRLDLNYTADICGQLKNYTNERDQVQILANNYDLYVKLITSVPSAIAMIFIGPWIDKYVCKPVMYIAVFGMMLQAVGLVYFSATENAPLYYTLLFAVPAGITGGAHAIIICTFTLSTEKTKVGLRTHKFGVLEVLSLIGNCLGQLSVGYIYDRFGLVCVFGVSAGLHVFLLIYIVLVVKDKESEKNVSVKVMLLDFFSCDNMRSNMRTALKRRANSTRCQIWLLIILKSIFVIVTSLQGFMFLFCNKMYGWTLPYYSDVSSASVLLGAAGILLGVTLMTRVWKVKDAWIGILGVSSSLAQALIRAFAYAEWLFFLSLAVGFMDFTPNFAVRSMLSKLVDYNEVGKIFSVMEMVSNMLPNLGRLLFNQVYDLSIDFFPGLIYLLAGFLLLMPFFTFLWMIRLPTDHYSLLEERPKLISESPASHNGDPMC